MGNAYGQSWISWQNARRQGPARSTESAKVHECRRRHQHRSFAGRHRKFANVEVVGEPGAQPEIRFEAPLSVSAPNSRIINMGAGEALVNGMNLTANYVRYRGDSARVESSWELGKPEGFQL